MTRQAQNIYEFGPYRIEAAKRLLLRDGEVVPLTPKCFEILLVLVENRGEVVVKEVLMNRVWPDSFVEEGNLTYMKGGIASWSDSKWSRRSTACARTRASPAFCRAPASRGEMTGRKS